MLTEKCLLTFKSKDTTKPATELIPLSTVNITIPLQNEYFQVQSKDFYEFKAKSQSQAMQWIQLINKYRLENINIPVIVECQRNHKFDTNFEILIPYDIRHPYLVNDLINIYKESMNHTHLYQ